MLYIDKNLHYRTPLALQQSPLVGASLQLCGFAEKNAVRLYIGAVDVFRVNRRLFIS